MDLKQLARDKGTNLKQVAEKCGIPPTTLYAISRGDTNFDNVGIGIAIRVANALDMTVEELYTGAAKKDVTVPVLTLDWNERSLIRVYREMNAQGKERLLEQAAFLAERHPKNQAAAV